MQGVKNRNKECDLLTHAYITELYEVGAKSTETESDPEPCHT